MHDTQDLPRVARPIDGDPTAAALEEWMNASPRSQQAFAAALAHQEAHAAAWVSPERRRLCALRDVYRQYHPLHVGSEVAREWLATQPEAQQQFADTLDWLDANAPGLAPDERRRRALRTVYSHHHPMVPLAF